MGKLDNVKGSLLMSDSQEAEMKRVEAEKAAARPRRLPAVPRFDVGSDALVKDIERHYDFKLCVSEPWNIRWLYASEIIREMYGLSDDVTLPRGFTIQFGHALSALRKQRHSYIQTKLIRGRTRFSMPVHASEVYGKKISAAE